MTAATLGRLVLALDDALIGDDPAMHAALTRLRAAWPAGLLDQADAAERDASRTLGAAAAAAGSAPPTAVHADTFPAWFRLGALDALTRWAAGKARTCQHAPDALHPQPVTAVAWKPGLIACRACPHLFRLPRGSAADRRCDGCGRVTAGAEVGDGIRPSTVQLGPLIYTAGACRDCCWGPVDGQAGGTR